MDHIAELRAGVDYVEAELRNIHENAEGRALTDDENERFTAGQAYIADTRETIKREEAGAAAIDAVDRGAGDKGDQTLRDKDFGIRKSEDRTAFEIAQDRSTTSRQLADGILRSLDEWDADTTQTERLLKRHLLTRHSDPNEQYAGDRWARNLLGRASEVYARAFVKFMSGRELLLTDEERTAMSVGTNANGGFLVPTHLDPTVILTNDGSSNALRPISRVVTLVNGDTWNGVSSAGVTMSWDGELAEVSDDSPTFAQPSIPVYKAQGSAWASVEAFEDIAMLTEDVLMMFADARDRLEGAAHCTGSGSSQPTGIFTAIDAGGNETQSTTAATIGLVDLQAVRRAVGQRWRNRSTWVMNPEWGDAISSLGSALSASYSVDATQSNTDILLGRPKIETDDAPNTATTTALDQRIVFGDFSNYVIVDKPGSTSVDFIPHHFNTANNLPDGMRGWYVYFRTGADSVNDAAFQLLMDKTSA